MIAEFLDKTIVLDVAEQILELPMDEESRRGEGDVSLDDAELVRAELTEALQREQLESSGPRSHEVAVDEAERRGGDEPRAQPIDNRAFISSDPIISLLQSSLDALYREPDSRGVVETTDDDDHRGTTEKDPVTNETLGTEMDGDSDSDRRILDKFSILDINWVRSKLAEGIRLFRGRRAFNTEPARPVTMPSRARLVLVGDWGSGLPRAQLVAQRMRLEIDAARKDGVAVHVVHLGDVYYSGWDHEYRRRFLTHWPVETAEASSVGSWNLNGNHDMYTGGHAYFGTALSDSRFARWQSNDRGTSSFFSIENDHWRILGLDTSYEDGGLQEPQAGWLATQLQEAAGRKTLLMSHHQYFSAYEKAPQKLVKKITPILERTPVTAWFWGHEHRCMHFGENHEVKHGRCLGDGGVPVYQWRDVDSPVKAPGTYEHRGLVPYRLERWARMGFAVLDFNGDRIEVRYIDEEGHTHARERIS